VSWILRVGPPIFALRPGKLCPSRDVIERDVIERDDAEGVNHAEFANVRESPIAIRPVVIAAAAGK
jgi:hypothetical protein